MFWACRDYLPYEIEILAPDIIWTQGERVYEAMSWLARAIEPADLSLTPQGIRRIGLRRHPATWIHTNHPSAKRGSEWGAAMSILQSVQALREPSTS